MKIQKMCDIYEVLKNNTRKKRIAVAYANDGHSIEAVYKAVKLELVEAVLIGDRDQIAKVCQAEGYDRSVFEIEQETSDVARLPKPWKWQGKGLWMSL